VVHYEPTRSWARKVHHTPGRDREVLSRCRFRTRDEARSVLFAYLEGFYVY
jgi:hypothetical protein